VNFLDDDSTEASSGDEGEGSKEETRVSLEGMRSEHILPFLQPLLRIVPVRLQEDLISDLKILFDFWASQLCCQHPSAPPDASSQSPSNAQQSFSAAFSSVNPSRICFGKKRALEDGSEHSGDEGDGDESRKRKKLQSKCHPEPLLRWACPFYQRSPHHFCVETEYGDFRKCAKSPGFSGVHRVKYQGSHLFQLII
jgi:hypothetical protein